MCRPLFRITIYVLIGGLCLLPGLSHATDASIEPLESDNFYEARGRFWAPPGDPELRGILILVPGTDSDGRWQAANPFWQALAQREHLGLLGVYFRGEGEPYEAAAGGSGTALLRMIDQVAVATGLARLPRLPLLFVGHSAGAMFAYNFSGWNPAKVAAFVAIKTGPITANPDPRFAAVPGLFILGEHDSDARVRAAAQAFAGVAHPAAWALAVEPGAGHEWTSADDALIEAYLHALLALPILPGSSPGPPVGTSLAGGCLRVLSSPSAMPGLQPASADTVWLPDIFSANTWAKFTRPIQVAALLTRISAAEPPELTAEPAVLNLQESAVPAFTAEEIRGSVMVQIKHANSSGCTFNSTDPRLMLAVTSLGDNHYFLEIRLRTVGLVGDTYRSAVSVVARDQKNARGEFSLPLLIRVQSAVRLTPASLYVGVLDRGEQCKRVVLIRSGNLRSSWKVSSIQSSNPTFATATEGEARAGDATFVCRFDAAKVVGNQSGHFDLVLEDGTSSLHATLPFIAFVSKRVSPNQHDAMDTKLP